MSAHAPSSLKPHIKLAPDTRFQRAIVCGAPERAALIASQMEGSVELAKNREYHSYLGRHQGVDVLIMSHGVGAPGATICFQEMMDVGVKSIIRLGTAGGLQDESRIGDIAVATSAVRQDGTTALMVPAGFPAVADPEITAALAGAVKVASEIERGVIVFIVCDGGWKYLSTGAYTDDLDEAEARAEKIIYF